MYPKNSNTWLNVAIVKGSCATFHVWFCRTTFQSVPLWDQPPQISKCVQIFNVISCAEQLVVMMARTWVHTPLINVDPKGELFPWEPGHWADALSMCGQI